MSGRLLLHHPLQGQALAPGAVTGPVRQHERRLGRVADDAAVGAPVAEPRHRPGVQEHLAHRLQAHRRVVEDREVQNP